MARSILGNTAAKYGREHPNTIAARKAFDETIVEEVVASLPPLTDAQRRRVVRLIAATVPPARAKNAGQA